MRFLTNRTAKKAIKPATNTRIDLGLALGAVLADRGVPKVLHSADYDLRSLDRDLGFRMVGTAIVAVGEGLSASLVAGSASVSLTGAAFGLKVNGAAVTFELKNGSFSAAIDGLSTITASSVLVQYTSATGALAARRTPLRLAFSKVSSMPLLLASM